MNSEATALPADELISVIVPIYNAQPYLDQALSSIENQTYRNIEIICLNDGSTDESLSIMQAHAARDERIVVIDKENQGYGASCNRGIDESHGAWIAILEPDDWIEEGMYRSMIDFAHSFPACPEIVKTPYWRILMPDTPEQEKINCSYKDRIHPPSQPFTIGDAAHLLTHHPSIWSAIYRKDFIVENGIRFHEIPGAGWADNPFLIDTLCRASRIAYLDVPFYCYREETPEKTKNFAINSPLVPLERWNDMADILDALGIDDERILRAHNSRGFTYLGGILEQNSVDDPAVRQATIGMFRRMDPKLVIEDRAIPPASRRLFCELLDLPEPDLNTLAYAGNLIEQGLYNLKNTSVGFTLRSTKRFFKTRKARSADR